MMIVTLLLASGCHRVAEGAAHTISPPEAYASFGDRIRARLLLWGIPWKVPCIDTSSGQAGAAVAATIKSDAECFRLMPIQRYRGLWRDDPEGARFCPAPAKECTQTSPGERIYFQTRDYRVLQKLQVTGARALYQVDFIGRRTEHRGLYGNGRLGDFPQEIIADRMISVKELEPPKNGPDEGTLK